MISLKKVPFRSISNSFQKCNFHLSRVCNTFFERDEKGGYVDTTRKKPTTVQAIRDGFKELKKEVALWSEEVKEHFEADPTIAFRPGETDVIWKFGNPNSLNAWNVTSDSDHNEGYSTCSLILNKHGKGVFSGDLSVKVPKDGRIKRAGYCNIKTLKARVLKLF